MNLEAQPLIIWTHEWKEEYICMLNKYTITSKKQEATKLQHVNAKTSDKNKI